MMNRSLRIGAVVCALSATFAAPAWANPFETTLANGMKLIVKEDRRLPRWCTWCGTAGWGDGRGGRRLRRGPPARAHDVQGHPQGRPGEFNKRVAAVGGRDNAFTGKDYTAYFQQVPPAHRRRMMALEADRMVNLQC
jgi:zinc protease